jgi:polysaccharide biosynthesis/export protein VpsN
VRLWISLKRTIVGAVVLVAAACASGTPSTASPQAAPARPEVSGQEGRRQEGQRAASGPQAPTPTPQAASATKGLADYKLDAGDQLKITVFGEVDLSGNFVVDGQGVISMSLIGEIVAKNLTLRELQRLIETRLRDENYLRNPQVSAEVVNYRPFYILGEVNKPGEYPYVSGLTLMNAIASAGDFTYRADKRRVFIKSKDAADEREIVVTPSTTIRPGDTIRIRERLF